MLMIDTHLSAVLETYNQANYNRIWPCKLTFNHFCLSVRFQRFDPLRESSRSKDFNGRCDVNYTKHVKEMKQYLKSPKEKVLHTVRKFFTILHCNIQHSQRAISTRVQPTSVVRRDSSAHWQTRGSSGTSRSGITCPTFTGARTIREYSHDDAHDHVDLRRTVIDTSARKKRWEHERRSYHDSASASELLTRQKYRQKRNYTMWRLTHAHERPTRGQSNEERETERERNGKLVADATTLCECVYAHVCRRRRVEREPKEKKGRVVTHVDA